MDLYIFILIGHIIGVAVGVGGAFTTDLLFFTASRDKKISNDEIRLIKAGSLVTWIGIAILLVTGFTLLYLGDFAVLSEARFQAKFTLVGILIANGAIFHFLHLPFIADGLSYAKQISARNKRRLYALVISGAISTTTWLAILVMAYAGGTDLSYIAWLGIYAGVLAIAVVTAIGVGSYHFPALSFPLSKVTFKYAGSIACVVLIGLSAFFLGQNIGEQDSIDDPEPSLGTLVPKNELAQDPDSRDRVAYAPKVPDPIDRSESALFEVHLEVVENECELDTENGVTFETWGYRIAGDEEVVCGAPGPVIRGRVGDVVRITLTNLPENEHPHDIDFHAVTGPGGGAKDLAVGPGESATIETRLLYPGVFMYHCAYDDPPEHIAHGMYGQFIVDPREPLPEVDHEWSVSQSEWYVTEEVDANVSLDRNTLLSENPRFITFNGTTDALKGSQELQMETGERARIYFVNQGLNLNSNFHPIGSHWDLVYPEGATHSANNPIVGSQSTAVVAGGGSVVELEAQVPGDIILVDHALSRAFYKGALGVISVTGDKDDEIFEVIKSGEGGSDHEHQQSEEEDVTKEDDTGTAGVKEFTLEAGNYYYSEEEIRVEKGDTVRITLESVDGFHDWILDEFDAETERVSDGESTTIEFVADEAGEFEYYCSVGQHRAYGQRGLFIVEE